MPQALWLKELDACKKLKGSQCNWFTTERSTRSSKRGGPSQITHGIAGYGEELDLYTTCTTKLLKYCKLGSYMIRLILLKVIVYRWSADQKREKTSRMDPNEMVAAWKSGTSNDEDKWTISSK